MLTKTKLALVAALLIGTAPVALAEDLDTELRNSGNPVYMNGSQFSEGHNAYARGIARRGGYTAQEKAQFDWVGRPE